MATPRFNLNTYSQGDTGWTHTDTVEFVDEYSIERGTLANRPSTGTYDDELYYAEDQGLLYQWDEGGSSWSTVAFGSASNRVPDTSYFDGVDANTASITTLTANDASVSSTPTNASDVAIKSYVDSVAQGLTWQQPVIDELNDPPTSPTSGDRYLINDAPTGDWSGHANEIAEWDGSQWIFDTPDEGWAVFIEDVDLLKVYQTGDWIPFGSAIDHGNLSGLGDDDHTQYVLVDGTRAMSGNLDMGNNDITNAANADADTYTVGGSTIAQDVAASGSVTLSSGGATVDTGVASSTAATFMVALGPDTDDADVATDIRAVSGGNYEVDILETDTSVGNPTVLYDIVRVR